MAAKNEAKIRFSAETKDFDKGIKAANSTLTTLRNELKLNEAQMRNNGVSVDGLRAKQQNLAAQMEAAQDKTKALSDKLAVAVEVFGENSTEANKLRNQLINAQTAEVKLQGAIDRCNAELERQESAANRSKTESEKLSDTISEQRSEVDKLKGAYVDAVLAFGEGSDEAKELARQIGDLSGELKDNKKRMDDAAGAADALDRSLDDAEDRDSEGFTVLKGALADLASEGIQAVVGAVSDMVSYFAGLPQETMELRQDFGTLTTAFNNVGLGAETATDIWKELYKVFGEDDRAVETANNIARIADNEKELNDWVTITTGIWGTYQDSLPVEGLAEAAAETAKTGTVTGGLADALNWSSEAATMFADYMSDDVVTAEDAFNVALSECSTEAERQALITDTLTKLYGGAADTYRDTTAAQMEAKEATADTILAEANLASAIEPVTTEWTNMKNELLAGILPVVEDVCGWLKTTMDWLQEHPVVLKILASVLGVVAAALTALTVVTIAQTVAQWALNSAILANPLTWIIVGIVAAIAAVVAIIVLVIEYWDEIVAAVKNACAAVISALQAAWDWIVGLFSAVGNWIYTNVIAPVAQFFTNLWNGIVTGVTNAWNWIVGIVSGVANWIYTNVIAPVVQFFTNLWNGIVSAYHTVIDPWVEIFRRAAAWVYENIIQPVNDFFTGLWQGIVSGVQAAWDWIVGICSTIATWFDENIIQPVANFFVGLWDGITTGVSNAIQVVKDVFDAVKTWLNDKIIQPIANFFSGLWDGFKNAAKNAWQGVKDVFSKVGQFFKDIFSAAWEKVKNVFSVGGKIFDGIKDGIVNAFKSVVNVIIKGINTVVALPFNGLNGILNTLNRLEILGVKPFGWLTWRAPVPQIPMLAEGGILDRPTLNIAGEAGPEAIIPIDKLQTYIESAIDKTMQTVNINALVAAVEDLASRPVELNINGRQFAIATASDTDTVNGNRYALSKRGLAL